MTTWYNPICCWLKYLRLARTTDKIATAWDLVYSLGWIFGHVATMCLPWGRFRSSLAGGLIWQTSAHIQKLNNMDPISWLWQHFLIYMIWAWLPWKPMAYPTLYIGPPPSYLPTIGRFTAEKKAVKVMSYTLDLIELDIWAMNKEESKT